MTKNQLSFFAVTAALAISGCHHPAATKTADQKPADVVATPTPVAAATTDEAVRKGLPDVATPTRLETVYFGFDKWTLDDAAKATLAHDAEKLKEIPTAKITVEGHTDERGTTQYNLALGQRRAAAVKAYLTSLGVPGSSLNTVSYGTERPAVQGHDESAWSKNRRSEISVSGSDRVSSSY